jgi:hypothetical protein
VELLINAANLISFRKLEICVALREQGARVFDQKSAYDLASATFTHTSKALYNRTHSHVLLVSQRCHGTLYSRMFSRAAGSNTFKSLLAKLNSTCIILIETNFSFSLILLLDLMKTKILSNRAA